MLEVLYFSDREVSRKVRERVGSVRGLLLVCGVRQQPGMRPPEEREPFVLLERRFAAVLHQLVVADEGLAEGMWRDPLGDLGSALFGEDGASVNAVVSGYTLIKSGRVLALVKKRASSHADVWFVQQALSRVDRSIPPPAAEEHPEGSSPRTPPSGQRPVRGESASDEQTPPRARRPPSSLAGVAPAQKTPFEVLGIDPGLSLDEAKKAFRLLVVQYHPDKVAHMAPEFRALAEERTREILAAWEVVERALR